MSSAGACKRCGNCCRQGGPALHTPDLELLRSGQLDHDELVTIRRGELALPPLSGRPEPVTHEFVKLRGRNGTWSCAFFDETSKGCLRYSHRPMACGLLDCTDTGPLLAIAGQDLLTRFACIAPDDPLLPLIHEHEAQCPCPDLETVQRELHQGKPSALLLADLEAAVVRDLDFRARATARYELSLGRELFCFGRPLFQLLLPLGLHAITTPTGIRLRCTAR